MYVHIFDNFSLYWSDTSLDISLSKLTTGRAHYSQLFLRCIVSNFNEFYIPIRTHRMYNVGDKFAT